MSLDPVSAVSNLAATVVKTIWPDKSEQERAQLAAALAIVQGQLEVNKAEAQSSSGFASGWRPFIGWICGAACAWNWIGLSVAKFALEAAGRPVTLAAADLTEMLPLLLGMLGLAGLRSFDKVRGTSS